MAEAAAPRSRSPSPDGGSTQGDGSSDDASSHDSQDAAAAAQEALGATPSDSDESRDLVPMQDLHIPEQVTPPEGSSPPHEESEPTDSTALLMERMGEIARQVRDHFRKYRLGYLFLLAFVSVIIAAVGLTVAIATYAPKEQARTTTEPPTPPPPKTRILEHWRPWRERKADNGLPRILLWNKIQHDKFKVVGYTVCATGRNKTVVCDVTHERSFLRFSDVVVFDDEHLAHWGMPEERKPYQKWVFWAKRHVSADVSKPSSEDSLSVPLFAGKINWTMAFRDDADIVIPYKRWRCDSPANTSLSKSSKRTSEKRKDVAWIVGTCEQSRFETQAPSLPGEGDPVQGHRERTVSLQLFPACGNKRCPSPHRCIPHIAENYNFIVVSLKPDCFQSAYELIYDAFQYNVVPVVLAPPNATLNVPHNSVVSSSNLQQPGQLAAHLRELLNDRALYESYFAWKENCSFVPSENEMCPLCRAVMTTPADSVDLHSDIVGWWTKGLKCEDDFLYGLDRAFMPQL
ncbi:3-galactosyl-N-acetylglucosaminide 4-alpha-L-fucosyltransferase FUT3-like isoform X2 [Dermacentor albipictus]